jgi:hypothetical protein
MKIELDGDNILFMVDDKVVIEIQHNDVFVNGYKYNERHGIQVPDLHNAFMKYLIPKLLKI